MSHEILSRSHSVPKQALSDGGGRVTWPDCQGRARLNLASGVANVTVQILTVTVTKCKSLFIFLHLIGAGFLQPLRQAERFGDMD